MMVKGLLWAIDELGQLSGVKVIFGFAALSLTQEGSRATNDCTNYAYQQPVSLSWHPSHLQKK